MSKVRSAKEDVHPSHNVGVYASRGLNGTLKHIRILLRVLELAPQHRHDLEAHDLLVLTREHGRRKGLGDKVGGPSSQLWRRVGCGERQNTAHDGRVVGGVAQDSLAGFIQLLELRAHRLHIRGSHGGQIAHGLAEGRRSGDPSASTLRKEEMDGDGR